MNSAIVSQLVQDQIALIKGDEAQERAQSLQVTPRAKAYRWDYGEPDQQYTCWIVLQDEKRKVGIAYCNEGFGPSFPWGLVWLTDRLTSMGMDDCWYETLAEALLNL